MMVTDTGQTETEAGRHPARYHDQDPRRSRPLVLVVEHDDDHGKRLLQALDRMGYDVEIAPDALGGLRCFAERRPDVVLIDALLPGMPATEVCRRMGAGSEVPVIMVTSVEVPIDIEEVLEAGAVDCLVKPERMRELVARIERARRPVVPDLYAPVHAAEVSGLGGRTVTVGPMRVDFSRRQLVIEGREVHLPRREFDLLAALLSPPGQLRTRVELIELLWAGRHAEGSRTLDTHVRRLRQKLESGSGRRRHIVTVRGVGFCFDVEGEQRDASCD
ncbi:MAG: response regulator transcription factor [Acidimicrobiales bacterium]|jgi:two-component system response regulator RegX3